MLSVESSFVGAVVVVDVDRLATHGTVAVVVAAAEGEQLVVLPVETGVGAVELLEEY